nr:immunoglobulin light chain junction region [Macaca mulatta]
DYYCSSYTRSGTLVF